MKSILGALLLILSLTSHATDDLTINVKATEPGFMVTLPANPTTGFQWTVVQFDKKLLTLSASHYEKPNTNLMGAGGQMQFTFMLNKGLAYPESTAIVLKYSRSWEPASATIKKVTVKFLSSSGK